MQAFVHFSVGVTGALLVLLLVDVDARTEFLAPFASGLWAMVPDLGWVLLRVGQSDAARAWQGAFDSPLGLVFWLHPVLDALEPEQRVYELTGGVGLLVLGVAVFAVANDWDR